MSTCTTNRKQKQGEETKTMNTETTYWKKEQGEEKKKREGISGKGIELKKPAWIDMKKELVRITKELKRAEKAMEPN